MADVTYALSLKQPWAALLVAGRKTVEVRKWQTARRGAVLIHAARGPDRRAEAWDRLPAELREAAELRGGIVGVGEITGCREYRDAATFRADENLHLNAPEWFEPPVLYGFTFANARPLPFRRCPGNIRFFAVEDPVNPSPGPSPKRGGEQNPGPTSAPPSLLGKGAGGLGLLTPHPNPPPQGGRGPELMRTGLLVSVRSAAEAAAALEGGASLIDVKEPARGPLGRADAGVIRDVVALIDGRVPVSAALGELVQASKGAKATTGLDGLAFVKWGLAGCAAWPAWWCELVALRERVEREVAGCRGVAVAYADWERAQSPPPGRVADLAAAERFGAFLIDTWGKDGTALLDWLGEGEIAELVGRCRAAGVRVALAGSLGREQVRALGGVRPDWFAVRGAVCAGSDRTAAVEAGRVRELVAAIDCRVGRS